jgi:drug/metabolite transporter (DMT)-like permease
MSAPLAKLLLGQVAPILLAGLLYLGAALGLWLHRLVSGPTREAALGRPDTPKLAAIVVAGGVLGPVLMLLGLERVTALAGALLLNLEAPLTVVVAAVFFREHLGRHATVASLFVFGGALLLKLDAGALGADTAGVLLLAAACACWALDNDLTQSLSLKDPFAIVRVKTLAAGTMNTVVGLMLVGGVVPPWPALLGALLLGSLSYGVSVVLDAFALRLIGAAREAAYFATAPFFGALVSFALFDDPLRAVDGLAFVSMALGVVFLLRERHGHLHAHEELVHEHLHVHDEHHQHDHGLEDPLGEPHSHAHRHAPLVHDHPHAPDAHHRHRH